MSVAAESTFAGGPPDHGDVVHAQPLTEDATKQDTDKVSISDASFDLVIPEATVGHEYAAKAMVLNQAVQSIGMGRYQILLFLVVGFGWASDNLWPTVTGLILPPVTKEYLADEPNPQRIYPRITLAQNIGLFVGAFFWGFGCDLFGRKWAFTLTLFFTAVFGLVAAGSPNFAAVGVFAALWSFGVGGNLPVDSAIFLEFLPYTHQYLLTVLSTYWAFAELFADLIAWPLIGYLTCSESEVCTKAKNMGWRYFVIVMGALFVIFFVIRFFFPVLESPKYLMGIGKEEEAVEVVHRLAKINMKATDLTVEDLTKYNTDGHAQQSGEKKHNIQSLEEFRPSNISALFATRRMAINTSLIIAIWALIGLAFPLYNAFIPSIVTLNEPDVYTTYWHLVVNAVMGVPACIIGAFLIEVKGIGRKGTLGASTILTGVFLFCSTTSKSSDQLLGWQCAFKFCSGLMYAVLYTYTPEIFPTKYRGTGNALTACANRIFGIMAPIIVMFADLKTPRPVYASGALFLVAGVLSLLLPLEPRGKASM